MEDTKFDPMESRWGFITFRAHVSEPSLFEDFLIIFLPILNTFTHYVYSIEKDNTPDRHIHCLFNLTSAMKDKSKIDQKFTNKFMKDFKKSLGLKQTDWSHAYQSKMVENSFEDFLKVLGYCIKDDDVTRRRVQNIPTNYLTQGIKFHVSTARIEKTHHENDWKAIKPQNVHALVDHFSKENDIDVIDTAIIPAMVKAKHTFVQIAPQQLKLALTELKYAKYQNDDERLEILAHAKDYREEPCYDLMYKKYKFLTEELMKVLNFDQVEQMPKKARDMIDWLEHHDELPGQL